MTTYNTGNPIGSTDPRDLYDNAENIDEMAVSKTKLEQPDRLGVPRKTWHGMETEFDAAQADKLNRFNALLANSGYEFLADYAAGITVTEYNQVIRDVNGELWRAATTTELPYTTTGAGMPEGGAFVPVGDTVLRQDLANPDMGAAMVARGVVAVDSITDLSLFSEGTRREDLRFMVRGFYPDSDKGGGVFSWDPNRQKSEHNGVTVYDPDKFIELGAVGEFGSFFSPNSSGVGVWVRECQPNYIDMTWAGCVGDGVFNRVPYEFTKHNGGVESNYPYEINEYVSGVINNLPFQAVAKIVEDDFTVFFPEGTYAINNESEYSDYTPGDIGQNSGGSWSWFNIVGKNNVTVMGEGTSSKIVAYQDATIYSLWGMRFLSCKNTVVKDLAIDIQGIGRPDADTHPLTDASGKAQTRIAALYFGTHSSGEGAVGGIRSSGSLVTSCHIRISHPDGAMFGESYSDRTNFDGSGKVQGIVAFGDYVSPVDSVIGNPPPNNANLVEYPSVVDCTFFETMGRTIWYWMTENGRVVNNKFIRCGGQKPVIRCLHWNKNLRIEGNLVEAENDWKVMVESFHAAAITVSSNNGSYISPNVCVSNNTVVTQDGSGIALKGTSDSFIRSNSIFLDEGHVQLLGSFNFTGIFCMADTSLQTDDKGINIRLDIKDNKVKGKPVSLYVSGSEGLTVSGNEFYDTVELSSPSSLYVCNISHYRGAATIRGNYVQSVPSKNGIYFLAAPRDTGNQISTGNMLITDNTIVSADNGIFFTFSGLHDIAIVESNRTIGCVTGYRDTEGRSILVNNWSIGDGSPVVDGTDTDQKLYPNRGVLLNTL